MTPHALISSLLYNCPSKAWYIAGGAVASPTNYGDIDIFVPSEIDFNHVHEALLATDCTLRGSSEFAISYLKSVNFLLSHKTKEHIVTIQLIKHFAPVEEQLSRFDINVCRRAILSNGTTYNHSTAFELLYVDTNLTTSTCARILKYHNRGFFLDYGRLTILLEQYASKELEGFSFYTGKFDTLTYEHTLSLLCSDNLQLSKTWLSIFLQLPQAERTQLALDRLSSLYIPHLNSFKEIPEFALVNYLQTRQLTPLVQEHYPEHLV